MPVDKCIYTHSILTQVACSCANKISTEAQPDEETAVTDYARVNQVSTESQPNEETVVTNAPKLTRFQLKHDLMKKKHLSQNAPKLTRFQLQHNLMKTQLSQTAPKLTR
ncbi:uncharacterized protein LOC144027114 [Festucalex cinctus]